MDQVDQDHLGALHGWHDAQHRHEHEGGSDEEEPAPTGLVIDLAQILAAPCGGPRLASASSIQLPALPPTPPRWHLALVEATHRHELHCSGWPPQRARRSGIATLLRSNHAILI